MREAHIIITKNPQRREFSPIGINRIFTQTGRFSKERYVVVVPQLRPNEMEAQLFRKNGLFLLCVRERNELHR